MEAVGVDHIGEFFRCSAWKRVKSGIVGVWRSRLHQPLHRSVPGFVAWLHCDTVWLDIAGFSCFQYHRYLVLTPEASATLLWILTFCKSAWPDRSDFPSSNINIACAASELNTGIQYASFLCGTVFGNTPAPREASKPWRGSSTWAEDCWLVSSLDGVAGQSDCHQWASTSGNINRCSVRCYTWRTSSARDLKTST